MACRIDGSNEEVPFLDLGFSPPSNAFLRQDQLSAPEVSYPLRLFAGRTSRLVQLKDDLPPESLFNEDYAYFSSYSSSWLDHCARFATEIINDLSLNHDSFVLEIASNDGYMLSKFVDQGIPCLGIDPCENVAEVARSKGVETHVDFFGDAVGRRLAAERRSADLIIGNNVLAHVPDPNDLMAGFQAMLAPEGVISLEFPSLMNLVDELQFDTIYHEHYSYFSLLSLECLASRHDLKVFDVTKLKTHGGSLRVSLCHQNAARRPTTERVAENRQGEVAAGLERDSYYSGFQSRVDRLKLDFLAFLIESKREGKRVGGYGAAAKGNTLLNYCGVRPDLVPYIVDKSPHKQGLFTPGMHIPVVELKALERDRPDFILILPWNLSEEISEELAFAREWGGVFVTAIPELRMF